MGSNKTALSGPRKRPRNISSCSKRPNADDNNDDNAAESQGDPEYSFLEDSSIQTDIVSPAYSPVITAKTTKTTKTSTTSADDDDNGIENSFQSSVADTMEVICLCLLWLHNHFIDRSLSLSLLTMTTTT